MEDGADEGRVAHVFEESVVSRACECGFGVDDCGLEERGYGFEDADYLGGVGAAALDRVEAT